MASRYLTCLHDLKNCGERIHSYATEGDWEALRREWASNDQIYAEFCALSTAGMTGAEKKEATVLIEEIRRINHEIGDLIQPRLSDLSQLLSKMSARLPT